MSKAVVIASALGLAAIVGLGTYELTARKNNDSFTPPTQTQAFGSPVNAPLNSTDAALPPGSTGIATTTYIPPHVTGPGQISESTTTTNTPLLQPDSTANALPPVNQANALPPANPANSLPPGYSATPVAPGNSSNFVALTPQAAPTESSYTETTTRIERPAHAAYVRHTARYHKKGKIHVARAVKHTAEFAVKMPGRLTL